MKRNKLAGVVIGAILVLLSACATSMSPSEVYNTLPEYTKTQFISQSTATKLVDSGRAAYLVRGRNYKAPIGVTVKSELRNAARGIDDWVMLDGGNAYVLTNFQWDTVSAGEHGYATQLSVEFDTLLYQ